VGERQFETLSLADGTPALVLTLGISWEMAPGMPRRFAVSAVESLRPYFAARDRVRAALAAGALLLAGMLFGGLALALRFGLRPLARLEREIAEIEAGSRELLGRGFPRELAGVASNLNALLGTERQRLDRYRATLGNLAHSLKTPLSALSSLLQGVAPERRELEAQVARMQDIVQHQLRRAVSGGAAPTLASTPVEPVIRELVAALAKVYRDKSLRIETTIADSVAYPIDRGDLMELVGNLLDNACKFGRRQVRLTAGAIEDPQWRRPGLELVVEDDGPGVPVADRDRVLERGTRADERTPGQGIGLAVVHEIVAALGGSMDLAESASGGVRMIVRLPGR
jgi:two-component system sensor histidine kinase PhoQ